MGALSIDDRPNLPCGSNRPPSGYFGPSDRVGPDSREAAIPGGFRGKSGSHREADDLALPGGALTGDVQCRPRGGTRVGGTRVDGTRVDLANGSQAGQGRNGDSVRVGADGGSCAGNGTSCIRVGGTRAGIVVAEGSNGSSRSSKKRRLCSWW